MFITYFLVVITDNKIFQKIKLDEIETKIKQIYENGLIKGKVNDVITIFTKNFPPLPTLSSYGPLIKEGYVF